jgi:hypothetical protein
MFIEEKAGIPQGVIGDAIRFSGNPTLALDQP